MDRGLIRVEVEGERLIITMADTDYQVIFSKHPDEPRLVQMQGLAVDRAAPLYHEEFEALAWEAAMPKRASWAGLFNYP